MNIYLIIALIFLPIHFFAFCSSSVSAADKPNITSGDHTRTLRVGELERRYRVYVPKKYDPSTAAPVVVVYHGGGGNPESMIRLARPRRHKHLQNLETFRHQLAIFALTKH